MQRGAVGALVGAAVAAGAALRGRHGLVVVLLRHLPRLLLQLLLLRLVVLCVCMG